LLSRLLRREKQNNSASSSQKITEEINPVTLMENVSKTLLSINDVKKQINDSRLIMEQKHRDLFVKCVRAQQEKESPFVAVKYALLCAQTKKLTELVIASQIDLERVVINAGTAKDFYDTAAKLSPIIQKVSENLAGVIPEVSTRLEQIEEILDNLIVNTKDVSNQTWVAPSFGREDEKTFVGFGVVDKKLRNNLRPTPTDGLFHDDIKKRM
jgi:division protein CdvB (Snf7/Vps24/ESCRT-III family)